MGLHPFDPVGGPPYGLSSAAAASGQVSRTIAIVARERLGVPGEEQPLLRSNIPDYGR